jgi:polysaccharide biosynthesis transport protein
MKANDLLRLIRKNIILIVVIPVLMGLAATFVTKDTFTSKSTLYTGLTSGTNVQLDQSFNLFTSNAGFDNLINVFQSRETSEEVAIRLLAMHLMMSHPDPKYISAKSFISLSSMTPLSIRKLVVKKGNQPFGKMKIPVSPTDSSSEKDTSLINEISSGNSSNQLIPSLNRMDYELTLKNLIAYKESHDSNFINELLTHSDPHYSIKAISAVKVQRIGSGDLIELKYTLDDPGICQQTLKLITEVGMKNYMKIKESRSDSVIKYFERKVSQAAERLMLAENQLQDFEQKNNIINYEDQSRDITKTTNNLEAALQSKRNKLSADNAALKAIELKLNNHQKIQVQNSTLLEKRNQLSGINAQILMLEASGIKDSATVERLMSLKLSASHLNDEIRSSVGELYDATSANGATSDNNLVNSWVTSTRDYEETKNEIEVLERKVRSSQKLYESYVPAGVTMKRIEREITVAEQEYLEVVHSLNLAKLKLQDIELSSSIKAVDAPNFPEMADPGKRIVLTLLASLVGFLLVLSVILMLEYSDKTLNNPNKASKILKLDPVGVFPRIPEKLKGLNFPFISSRLLEMIIQEMDMYPKGKPYHYNSHARTILFFSTLSKEGKSFLVANIARKLKMQGKKVRVITFSGEDLLEKKLAIAEEDIGTYMTHMNTPLLGNQNESAHSSLQLTDYKEETPEISSLTLEIPETDINSEEHVILQVDESYYSIRNYKEILQINTSDKVPFADYTLIELPPILSFPYPAELVASADLSVMVCQSTRSWSEADEGALATIMRLNHRSPLFLLNGVNLHVVKSTIGQLPKIRKRAKKTKKGISKILNKVI